MDVMVNICSPAELCRVCVSHPANHSVTTAFSYRMKDSVRAVIHIEYVPTITSSTPFSLNTEGTSTPWASAARTCSVYSHRSGLYVVVDDILYRGYLTPSVFRRAEQGSRLCTSRSSCRGAPKSDSKTQQQLVRMSVNIHRRSNVHETVPRANPICSVSSRLQAMVFPKRFSSLPFLCPGRR